MSSPHCILVVRRGREFLAIFCYLLDSLIQVCQVLDKFGVYFVLVLLVISPMSFLVKIPLYERILSTASM